MKFTIYNWELRISDGLCLPQDRDANSQFPIVNCKFLPSDRESGCEDFRQPRFHDLGLRLLHRILSPAQLHLTPLDVDDGVGGARVAVSRLTDGSGIDQVLRRRIGAESSPRRVSDGPITSTLPGACSKVTGKCV